jgi:hypothetical protein
MGLEHKLLLATDHREEGLGRNCLCRNWYMVKLENATPTTNITHAHWPFIYALA